MLFNITGKDFLDASYTNDHGDPIYKVHTTRKLCAEQTTTISRILPSKVPRRGDADTYPSLEDRFAHLAQIDWRQIRYSTIRFGGEEINTKTFFRREGMKWNSYGRHRIFTAPDGKDYKWMMLLSESSLVTNDGSQTPVACYKANEKLFSKTAPTLEIFPAGEHMVDLIVVTLLYIEKNRKDRETALIVS